MPCCVLSFQLVQGEEYRRSQDENTLCAAGVRGVLSGSQRPIGRIIRGQNWLHVSQCLARVRLICARGLSVRQRSGVWRMFITCAEPFCLCRGTLLRYLWPLPCDRWFSCSPVCLRVPV